MIRRFNDRYEINGIRWVAGFAVAVFTIIMFAKIYSDIDAENRAACHIWKIQAVRCGICDDIISHRPRGCSLTEYEK